MWALGNARHRTARLPALVAAAARHGGLQQWAPLHAAPLLWALAVLREPASELLSLTDRRFFPSKGACPAIPHHCKCCVGPCQ